MKKWNESNSEAIAEIFARHGVKRIFSALVIDQSSITNDHWTDIECCKALVAYLFEEDVMDFETILELLLENNLNYLADELTSTFKRKTTKPKKFDLEKLLKEKNIRLQKDWAVGSIAWKIQFQGGVESMEDLVRMPISFLVEAGLTVIGAQDLLSIAAQQNLNKPPTVS